MWSGEGQWSVWRGQWFVSLQAEVTETCDLLRFSVCPVNGNCFVVDLLNSCRAIRLSNTEGRCGLEWARLGARDRRTHYIPLRTVPCIVELSAVVSETWQPAHREVCPPE